MTPKRKLVPFLFVLVACSSLAQPSDPGPKTVVAPSPRSAERQAELDSLVPYEAAARALCAARLAKIEPSRRWIFDPDREWGLTLRRATSEDTDATCERYMDDDGVMSLCVMERGGDRAEKVWQTYARELKEKNEADAKKAESAAEIEAVKRHLPPPEN